MTMLINLQQFSPFYPFMRQLIALADVAMFTSDHNVAHIVSTTARKRNNVISVPFIFKWFVAVVAPIVLVSQLFKQLLCSMATFSRLFSGFPALCCHATCKLAMLSVFVAETVLSNLILVLPSIILSTFTLPIRIRSVSFDMRFFNLVRMVLAIPFGVLSWLVWISLAPLTFVFAAMFPRALSVNLSARFTLWVKTVFALRKSIKKFRCGGICLTTPRATSSGDFHSASLSLYLKMLPAGGEINRFSGATLADALIITQKGAL